MEIDITKDPVGYCIQGLNSENARHRHNAADMLRGLCDEAEPAIDILCELLVNDPDIEVRRQCAFTLLEISYSLKERAIRAVPYLEKAIKQQDEELTELAVEAIQSITT